MHHLDNLSVGIISGLVTMLFVVGFRAIWIRILVPWFENRVYKDVSIEGRWTSLYDEGNYGTEAIRIRQTSHNISGTLTTLEGPDSGNVYEFEGVFKNLILTSSYRSRSSAAIDRGTITLTLKANGTVLDGYCVFYDDEQNSVISEKYSWTWQ